MTAFTVVPSRSGAGERACGGAWCGVVWHSTAQHCMQSTLEFTPLKPAVPPAAYPTQPRPPTVRTFDQRTVLDMFSGRITAVSLSGYLFFGRWAVVWRWNKSVVVVCCTRELISCWRQTAR